MDLTKTCYLLIVYLMVRFCAAESLNCIGTHQPDGLFFYQVSPSPTSSSCNTCWEDENRTVIARDLNFDPVLVLNVTDSSIKLKACRKHLHFIQECAEKRDEADCRVISTKTCVFEGWCPDLPILLSFLFGILLLLGIFFCLCIYKLRRRSAAMTASYTTVTDQVKVTAMERRDEQSGHPAEHRH
ncbi:hypothetical protein PAMP_024026 [Pampus punctatissimus]